MGTALRKFRKATPGIAKKAEPPVLIVRPHNVENQTCQQTSAFITRAIMRRIAECQPLPSKLPELARNFSINDFLHNYPKKTHIFFLDDDSPPINQFAIEKLLRFDKPVVAGVTPIWRYSKNLDTFDLLWSPVITREGHTEETPMLDNIGVDELPKSPFTCYRTGGTGMLIRREVLEKLEPPYQKTTFNQTVTGVDLSEDMYFSDTIRKAGYRIWIDPEVVCSHFHIMDILDVFKVYITAVKQRQGA